MLYCAHAIFFYAYDGQSSYLVHENVYLVSADDDGGGMAVAMQLAAEYEQVGEESCLEIEGKKAEYKFAGIRKLISVQDEGEQVVFTARSGIEVTYPVMEVRTLADVERIAAGDSVMVNYRE